MPELRGGKCIQAICHVCAPRHNALQVVAQRLRLLRRRPCATEMSIRWHVPSPPRNRGLHMGGMVTLHTANHEPQNARISLHTDPAVAGLLDGRVGELLQAVMACCGTRMRTPPSRHTPHWCRLWCVIDAMDLGATHQA